MDFRQKIECKVGKTTNFEFKRACNITTDYIKENYVNGTLREKHVIETMIYFIQEIRSNQDNTFKFI